MFVSFTEVMTGKTVSINPDHVVAVFTVNEGEQAGKTAIGVVNGSVIVSEAYDDVVSQLNSNS